MKTTNYYLYGNETNKKALKMSKIEFVMSLQLLNQYLTKLLKFYIICYECFN